jgi:superfamily II DNA or RNA helicase/HKD family nuclease
MKNRGLYEVLVTESLRSELDALAPGLSAAKHKLRSADAADRIALHLQLVLRRYLHDLPDHQRVEAGIELARAVVALAAQRTRVESDDERPTAEVLQAIQGHRPDGTVAEIVAPSTPLLDTTLLTNAPGEPRIGHQLLSEIASADRIDVVMAFIRRTGIKPMIDALRRHCAAGRALRVLTTTYTGSTELEALEALRTIGGDVRVSYDTSCTRLHAKAWLFHRDSGFSTAFVGSSNLTHSAQVMGLEWNVRVSGIRNGDVVQKVAAVFDAYWESADFRPFAAAEFVKETSRPSQGPQVLLGPIELQLHPFQERLLEQVASSLQAGRTRNLLVAATGTGKTVMAAVHYARRRRQLPRDRLLFVAHRTEILEQALATFRYALRDASFGELWVDGKRPRDHEHVFASIQSLHAAGTAHLPPDHFDVVIVDEFHHATASTYDRLLGHVAPRELLGLTATPERADGFDVLRYFDGHRIAAELRLWDAIDQQRLSPFAYFGVHDGLDLTRVPWTRGRGYSVDGLTNVMDGNEIWARRIIQLVHEHVEDVSTMRALGFCVSVQHARFMTRMFNEAGIRATAVWADSPAEERKAALQALARGEVNVLFSVDLFNEGVDVPVVDTLLMLRPTESPTLFLQQLGRGLRKASGKTVCTVLDFVGTHRKEFRFDRRFRGLFEGTRQQLRQHVENDFPFLPAGCHMALDRIAKEAVLQSIRSAIPSRWPEKVAELRQLARRIPDPSLVEFLTETGLDLEDIYAGAKCWSDLREDAGLAVAAHGPDERSFRRAVGRLLHVDDAERQTAYRARMLGTTCPDIASMDGRERRLARMLLAQLGDQVFTKATSLQEGWERLWRHPQVRAEVAELMAVLRTRTDHLHATLPQRADVPLQVHARYTRIEILAAFGEGDGATVAAWQTGVRHLEQQRADLLAFTLDKSSGSFSPTTRYRDHAISRELIHWESQSVTRADSETGRRYQQHAQLGSDVYLFARLRDDDRSFWFLGPASFVSSRGEKPMAIVWRLQWLLPGDLFTQFAAAVA